MFIINDFFTIVLVKSVVVLDGKELLLNHCGDASA